MRIHFARYATVGVVLALAALPALAGTFSLDGEWWDGELGSDADGMGAVYTGTVEFAMTSPTTGTATFTDSGGDPPEIESIVGISQLPGGWTHIETQSGENWTGAASSNFLVNVHRTPEDGSHLAINLLARKPVTAYTAADLMGAYGYVRHSIEFGGGTSMSSGSVMLNGDGTFAADFWDLETDSNEVSVGTWSWNAAAAEVTVMPTGSPESIVISMGEGLMAGRFSSETGAAEMEVLTRMSPAGRGLAEAAGTWLIQGLLTDPAGSPETSWGTLAIDALTGTYSLRLDTSAGGTVSLDGSVVMSPNGILTLFDGQDDVLQGVISLDGDVISLATFDEEPFMGGQGRGTFFAVPTPEPATLGLLLLGALGVLRRRPGHRAI